MSMESKKRVRKYSYIVKGTIGLSKKVAFFVMLIWFFSACSSNAKNKTIDQTIEIDNLQTSSIQNIQQGINYKIPTPMELFVYLEKNDVNYIADILHHPLKYKDYYSIYKKGLNFGIYSADLAYATIYSNHQDAILYFKAAKELASLLGLYEGYGQVMAQRINNNLENIDSLIEIAADSYNQSVVFLESQGSSELLSLIITGSWIEALFISTQSISTFDINNPLVERVADQQLLLDNLLSFLEPQEKTSNISRLIILLEKLQEEYDALYFNEEETMITASQFVNISNKVSDIRTEFISQK